MQKIVFLGCWLIDEELRASDTWVQYFCMPFLHWSVVLLVWRWSSISRIQPLNVLLRVQIWATAHFVQVEVEIDLVRVLYYCLLLLVVITQIVLIAISKLAYIRRIEIKLLHIVSRILRRRIRVKFTGLVDVELLLLLLFFRTELFIFWDYKVIRTWFFTFAVKLYLYVVFDRFNQVFPHYFTIFVYVSQTV